MCQGRSGFSLLELLLVIVLMSLLVTVVGPPGMALYDRYALYLEKKQLLSMAHRASWEAFIRRQTCGLRLEEEESGQRVALLCGGRTLEYRVVNAQPVQPFLAEFLPRCFDRLGGSAPCAAAFTANEGEGNSLSAKEKTGAVQ